ncbi:oligoribonuclease [Epithele typhae]|uniref:oligoribonuclease n=1 Tax=Epithele typhae TaxID=378194 RepID=UPI002007B2CE|nr:oligoribonuclease [Epithele typhae]KAH9942224.1 oligoribonuclease [Epithele typhae]
MTGLSPRNDKILEIAVLITDGNLKLMDEGVEFIVKMDKGTLDNMSEWCIKTHGQTGLTQACLDSPYTSEFVQEQVLNYIKRWIPAKNTGMLAGNSVHMDKMFLMEQMPDIIDYLHYRIIGGSKSRVGGIDHPPRGDPLKNPCTEHLMISKVPFENIFMPPHLAPPVDPTRKY